MLGGTEDADLVLISDGGGVDAAAVAEAERLSASGVRFAVLTLPAAGDGPSDPDRLADLADAVAPARSPDPVLARLASGGRLDADPALTALRFRDLGPFIAALAALPMLGLFRRRT